MSVIELPPSPNWYQSAICSTSSACGGLMACGAKDSVLVLAFADGAFVGSEHELSERLSFASCVCVCVCVDVPPQMLREQALLGSAPGSSVVWSGTATASQALPSLPTLCASSWRTCSFRLATTAPCDCGMRGQM